ncbi:MAG: ThuA domain-containing protein [Haliscomenobacter sp.]|uniref:PVC-type heme-binding CxxCH protein n=1 Tax=Haliscomenobacter sp. TaxID=2717303 RepID=UPI0029AECC8C|nr:PVC-type heme-binding CxxCH protein [Haliscomenobacter sp.]MDX2069011.1 ThuA domain-containing protein [Haliscomenobacter sp.]
MKKLLILSLLLCAFSASAQKARRLEVLFLGDNGHHRPIERVPSIMAALGDKGVNFTYTDQLSDLNLANLNKYDALMIYANWDSISPAVEKDLLAYVAAGKGILPIHCASYCFRNSSEYVKMVGGQFWRHRMDTIQTTTVQPEHFIMQGLKPFKAFDETYLHSKLQPDNNVLAVREIKADQFKDKPDTKTEPYTWTRSYGKGRVFYTAYGHDENTWQNEGFHALILRGILWAVDDEARKAHAALKPEAFVYREAKLPNYEKRPGIQYRQDPLSPEESMKHIQVPVEFNLELFASEPNVMHPIAISWDERGRMYVLITKDYPNERKPGGGSDYILICEDTNKDGKADKFTRFAEGLSIPTGMVFSNGGLVVSQAPDMLFLKDTDGDDKADVRQVLFTGFGTFDTHAGPSNLHYGFDNWLWGSVGYSGFKGLVGSSSDTIRFSQGFFRFKPDGSKLEYVTRTSNNTWGLGFNETGDVFGSTANNAHGWYMAIPNQFYTSTNGIDNGSTSIDTHKDMKTITPKVRQVDVFGGFTAAAGHNVYTARAFPKKYWNNIAFVAEPTGHVLHQNVLTKSGTNFSDTEGFNLMAGADEWFSPVFAEVGPDGAVWVADWYSFIIQHNPRPDGFVMGSGNAYETDLRDYTHGRIYRVSYKEAAAYQALTLSKDKPQELLAALKNTNLFWRSHAQRLLVERNQKDVVPGLLALIRDKSVDEIGINAPAIHALWTLQGLNALEGEALNVVFEALKHPCPGVRKTAVQILPRTKENIDALLKNKTLGDQEPLVVLQTLLAISEIPLNGQVESLILQAIESSKDLNDRWLPDAYAGILAKNPGMLKKVFTKLQEKAAAKTNTMNNAAGHHDHTAMMGKTEPKTQPSATPTQADLVVSNIIVEPSNPMPRERVTISIEVRNEGGVAVPKGVVVPLNIRFAGKKQLIDMVSLTHTEGIKPGETVTITKVSNGPWTGNIVVAGEQAGEYTFTVAVDKANTIIEGNETNNVLAKKINVALSQSMEQYVLVKAIRSNTPMASISAIVDHLKNAQKLDAEGFAAILKGISEGWDYRKKVSVSASAADKTYLNTLLSTSTGANKDRLTRLMQAWDILKKQEENDPSVQTVRIKAIREMLQFDLKTFTVKAGKTVEIVFENPDAMQHNLVIGKPKSLEKIGKAADKMITDPDGATKNYVPDVADVLFSTALVNPDQTVRLRFTAPAKAGDYPYVCTFPGHWRIMNGVMKVE